MYFFQNVTDEDSMVVQHILAVRKGTREASNLIKDDKNLPSDTESEIKKENEEVTKEEKSDEVIDEKPANESEEKINDEPEEKSDVIKTEHEETEPNSDETEKDSKKTIEVDEYYVKYRNFSYLHCEWKTEEELMKGDKRIAAKLKRFKQKMANNTNIFENVSSLIN